MDKLQLPTEYPPLPQWEVLLLVVVLVCLVWTLGKKLILLSFWQKLGLLFAVYITYLVIANVLQLPTYEPVEAKGVPTTLDGFTLRLLDVWRRVDGFAREHRWIGLALLAAVPIIVWPTDEFSD